MKTLPSLVASLLVAGFFVSGADAAILAQYADTLTNNNASNSITAQDKKATAFANNVNAGELNLLNTGGTIRVRFAGATEDFAPDVNGSKNQPATGWFVFNQNQTGFTGAATSANAGTYMGITLSASEGYKLNIDGFSYVWNAGVNSISSTVNYYSNVYYAINGSTTFEKLFDTDNSLVLTGPGSGIAVYPSAALLESALLNIHNADSVEFRIAMNGTHNSSAAQFFKDIQVTGSVTPVPEPATYALAALATVGGLVLVRRRVRK